MSEVILYLVGGGIAFWLTLGLLAFFTEAIGLHYMLSLTIGYVIGFSFNFWFQDTITFKEELITHRKPILFFIIQLAALFSVQILTFLLTEEFGMFYQFSYVLASAIIAIASFVASKMFVFNARDSMR